VRKIKKIVKICDQCDFLQTGIGTPYCGHPDVGFEDASRIVCNFIERENGVHQDCPLRRESLLIEYCVE
jgi:hypothetical protein